MPAIRQINNGSDNSVARVKQNSPQSPESQTGTLEKMIVADGNAAMDIDLNRLNGIDSPVENEIVAVHGGAEFVLHRFLSSTSSCVGPELGSMTLIPQSSATLPAALNASINQLVIEKAGWTEPFDLVVRDGKTGLSSSILKEISTNTMPSRRYSVSKREDF